MLSGLGQLVCCRICFAPEPFTLLCPLPVKLCPTSSTYLPFLLDVPCISSKVLQFGMFLSPSGNLVSLSSSSVSGLERSSWQSSKHGCITTVANSPLCRSTIQVEKVPGISRRRTHAGFRQPLSHPATQLQHQASLPLIVCSQKTCRPCGCARRSASQAVEPPKFPPTHN